MKLRQAEERAQEMEIRAHKAELRAERAEREVQIFSGMRAEERLEEMIF